MTGVITIVGSSSEDEEDQLSAEELAAGWQRQHIGNGLVLVASRRLTNAAVVQALINNLFECGLDPKVCRLFIFDAKALSKVIRGTFARTRRSSGARFIKLAT